MEKMEKLPNFVKVKKHRKLITKQNIIMAIVFVIFFVYAITLLFPFVWMLLTSFRTSKEFLANPWGFPETFNFSNYTFAAMNFTVRAGGRVYNLITMFGISIFFTVFGTLANVLSSAVSAYVVAKYKFVGRNFLYSLSVFLMVIPIVGTMPAQYRLMDTLGLINNPLGMIVVYSGSFGLNFFLLYGFFKSISWSYAEAAYVDGAGHATIFFKVMIPLALPALISVAVIYSIGVWNDFVAPSLYMKNIPTLAVGLQKMIDKYDNIDYKTKMFAAMMIALIPIMIIFIAFQKTIMQNTVAGGLKG